MKYKIRQIKDTPVLMISAEDLEQIEEVTAHYEGTATLFLEVEKENEDGTHLMKLSEQERKDSIEFNIEDIPVIRKKLIDSRAQAIGIELLKKW